VTTSTHRDKAYRVLLVEDVERVAEDYRRQLGRFYDVTAVVATSQTAALEALAGRYFDLAVVDIELDVPAGGYEVLRAIASTSPSMKVIVATRYVDSAHIKNLLGLTGGSSVDIRAVVDKGEAPVGWLADRVEQQLGPFRESAIKLDGLELFVEPFGERERIKRIADLRGPDEVALELDRIFRRMFGLVKIPGHAPAAEVRFSAITREGLSAAVTLEAQVQLGLDASGAPVPGNRCVVKVGAREEIAEEARRYDQFVKFGVRLAHRVELLSHVAGDALAAICYSFAGGVFGTDVVTLDELLHYDDDGLALATLEQLFDPGAKEWYGIDAGRLPVAPFFRDTYGTSFRDCYDRLDRSLTKGTRLY
jgi:CheY-like chemotaxis protein